MKPIYYDRHARRRMRERGITPEDVAETLRTPDRVEPSIKGRFNAFRRIGGRLIRVTFREETDHLLVITAVWKR